MTANTNPYDQIRASDAMIARVRERHPMLIDLTLRRIEGLLDKLGRPQDRLPPIVHIAGTNGKGSTAAYVRAIAEAAGLSVHVLTSPHLVRFAERIRLAGTLITDEHMAELIDRVEAINGEDPISFFELTTAVAIQAFAETPADLTVIEVGLGGRYDATNVFAWPAVTVITPIDYDHTELLGPTLTKIAGEKAGILRKAVPCVVARQPEEAFEVIEREAASLDAPLMVMGRDFDAWEERGRLMVQMPHALLDLPAPALFGVHQFDNAGLAAAAALALNHVAIDEEGHRRGHRQRGLAGPVPAADRGACGGGGESARGDGMAGWRPQSPCRRGSGGQSGKAFGPRSSAADADCRHAGPQGRRGLLRRLPRSGPGGHHHRLQLAQRHSAGDVGRAGAVDGAERRSNRRHRRRPGTSAGQR